MYAGPEIFSDYAWFPDSRASSHITTYGSNLMRKSTYTGGEQVFVSNGKGLPIERIGYSCV